MGQLEEEIEEASRGRILPTDHPDHSESERRLRSAEEKFDRVVSEKTGRRSKPPSHMPGKDEDLSP